MVMLSLPLFTAFALMTAVAALAVLWPLGRARALKGAREADLAVYRDQLAEITRDRESGRLPAEQAEAARVEVARRMLAADSAREREPMGDVAARSAVWRRRAAALAALVVIPACAVGLYTLVGSPALKGAPLAERLAAPPNGSDINMMVRRVEESLAARPDGRGYEVLAPVYLRLGRPQDAANAYGEAIRLLGPSAERYSAMGEALVMAASGIVTADAQQAFKQALALDPTELRSRFYSAVAAEQDGRPKDAAAIFRQMIAEAGPDAPYLAQLKAALARLDAEAGAPAAAASEPSAAAPGPSTADVEAAASMSAQDRSQMIRGMVERLETRLKAEPNDLDGWLRLAQAFTVLGDKGKAEGALKSARDAFAGNAEALARIDAAAKSLGSGG